MRIRTALPIALLALSAVLPAVSQTALKIPASSASTAVPPLIPYSAIVRDANGKPLAAEIDATFLIYKDEEGGSPLWLENQTAALDATGRYQVQLGAKAITGIPLDLFSSGEARWLEVQIAGQPSQPRVLLVSVPYALKAADAATLGGLPASAFALAASSFLSPTASGVTPNAGTPVTTTGGTAGYLPEFSGASTIVDSPLFVLGADIGIGTTAPTATLDVNGTSVLNGSVTLPALSTATASAGFNSQELKMYTSAYNSSTKAAVDPRFYWEAEVAGNDTAAPGATLNLLSSVTTAGTTETGFHFNSNGTINFAAGQTFPGGGGSGTITGVTAGSGLTGGGTSGTVTLAVSPTTVPLLASANTFTATQDFTSIGIGTATPRSQLEIVATASKGVGPVLTLTNTAGGLGAESTVDFNTVQPSTTGTYNPMARIAAQDADHFSDNLIFQSNTPGTSDNNGLQTNMVIQSNGQTGINTIAPGAQLEVDANPALGDDAIYGFGATTNSGAGTIAIEGKGGPATGSIGIEGYGGTSLAAAAAGEGGVFYGGNAEGTGPSGDGIDASPGSGSAGSGYAGNFNGDVNVTGTVSSDAVRIEIDHPLDPTNKYLAHASVESSEMVNVYSGNVTTDELGIATVHLPEWFEAVNADFRYQLTVVGKFAQAIISTEIANHEFKISTNAAFTKVSWQVTGVRRDAYARAHPLVVEREKPAGERGFYSHPELYGQPAEKQMQWARHPEVMRRSKALQARKSEALATRAQVPTVRE